jgi:hypothetical protein
VRMDRELLSVFSLLEKVTWIRKRAWTLLDVKGRDDFDTFDAVLRGYKVRTLKFENLKNMK